MRRLYDFRSSFNHISCRLRCLVNIFERIIDEDLSHRLLILQAVALQQIPLDSSPVSSSPSRQRNEGLVLRWWTSTVKTYGPPLDQAPSFAIPAIPRQTPALTRCIGYGSDCSSCHTLTCRSLLTVWYKYTSKLQKMCVACIHNTKSLKAPLFTQEPCLL